MSDEEHGHLTLELVDNGGEVFSGGGIEAASENMGSGLTINMWKGQL